MTDQKIIRCCLIGAPGAGKGTQAELLCQKYNLQHISTGNLLRAAMAQKTSLGLKVQALYDQGHLVPDSLMISLIKSILSDRGFVLDGFPRTVTQAKALDQLMKEMHLTFKGAFYFEVSHKVLIERISGRRVAEKSGRVYHTQFHPPKKEGICDVTGEKLIQRKDDHAEVAAVRLKAYEEQTQPVIDYYKKKQMLFTVKASGSKDEIFSQFLSQLS